MLTGVFKIKVHVTCNLLSNDSEKMHAHKYTKSDKVNG